MCQHSHYFMDRVLAQGIAKLLNFKGNNGTIIIPRQQVPQKQNQCNCIKSLLEQNFLGLF